MVFKGYKETEFFINGILKNILQILLKEVYVI